MIYTTIFGNLLSLIIFLIPMNFKAKINYDILKNKGKLQLKLFKLTILNYKLSIHQGFIELLTKKGKIKIIPIDFNQKGFLSDTDYISVLVKKIKIQQATTYIKFGAQTDAFLTAILIETFRVFTSIFGCILKENKKESKIKNKVYPVFNKDKFEITFKASVKISISKLINSFIIMIFNKIKNKKEIVKNER